MPNRVISVVQIKGGSAKTTLAINLGAAISNLGLNVSFIDADPQGSSASWAELGRLPFDVALIPGPSHWDRYFAECRADVAVIDTPGRSGTAFNAAVAASDVMLVPCAGSSLDLLATERTLVRINKLVRARSPKPTIMLVPTRVDPRTDEGQQIVEELRGFGFPVATAMSYDTNYVRAFSTGVSVDRLAPGGRADREMRAIAKAALGALDVSTAVSCGRAGGGRHTSAPAHPLAARLPRTAA